MRHTLAVLLLLAVAFTSVQALAETPADNSGAWGSGVLLAGQRQDYLHNCQSQWLYCTQVCNKKKREGSPEHKECLTNCNVFLNQCMANANTLPN